jgi:hypothetical protein
VHEKRQYEKAICSILKLHSGKDCLSVSVETVKSSVVSSSWNEEGINRQNAVEF